MNNNLPPLLATSMTGRSIKLPHSSEMEVEQPHEIASPVLSANEKNDETSKNASGFEVIEKFKYIQRDLEDKNHAGLETTISYSRSKDEVGKKNLGMLGKVGDKEYLIKEGVVRSLLNQIANCYLAEDMEGVERKAGFIAATYLRSIGLDLKLDLEEYKAKEKSLQKELSIILKDFFKSENGQKILDNKINISNVNEIHKGLVTQNPENKELKNILGIAILMDVISGVAGQQLVNDYQRTYLASDHIPNAKLFLVENNPLIGAQFLDLERAQSFDQFLWKSFVPQGTTLEAIRQAAALIKWGDENVDKEAAHQLLSTINLEEGKNSLAKKLKEMELNGLAASIFIRSTMGESADLGPDNMLLVEKEKGRHQIINIDVTGFRYPRKGNELEKPRLGWNDIIQDLNTSSDELLNKLFDVKVFSDRYTNGADEVYKAIVEVLRKNVTKKQASDEVQSVCDWYASLKNKDASPNAEDYKLLLRDMAKESLACIDESVRPDEDVMHDAIERNCSVFIDTLTEQLSKVSVAVNSENFPLSSLG